MPTSSWAMAAGVQHAVAVDVTARAWGWGDKSVGAIGTGESNANTTAPSPERSDLGGALALAAGEEHTLAIGPDGSVKAVGVNAGRFGNGSTTSSDVPVTIGSFLLADNSWLTDDADDDTLETWREYLLGTDPLNPDSNGNGVLDGLDDASGSNAANPDVDGDSIPNWVEQANGTDPYRADSDGDSYNDDVDAFPLDASRHNLPSSNPYDTTGPVITLKEPVSARPVP